MAPRSMPSDVPSFNGHGASTDPRASLFLRMLDLKRKNPVPVSSDIAKAFTLGPMLGAWEMGAAPALLSARHAACF